MFLDTFLSLAGAGESTAQEAVRVRNSVNIQNFELIQTLSFCLFVGLKGRQTIARVGPCSPPPTIVPFDLTGTLSLSRHRSM